MTTTTDTQTLSSMTEQLDDDYLGAGEAARILGVSTETLRRWTREGKVRLAARTLGGQFRFRRSDIDAAKSAMSV